MEFESEGALEEACAAVSRDKNPAYVKDWELRYVAVNDAYAALWDTTPSSLIGQQSHQHFDAIEQDDRDEKERRTLVFGKGQVAHFVHPLKNLRFRINIERDRRADQKPFIHGHFVPISGVRFENKVADSKAIFSGEKPDPAAKDARPPTPPTAHAPAPLDEADAAGFRGDYALLKSAIELAEIPVAVEDETGRVVASSVAFLENRERVTITSLPNGGKLHLAASAGAEANQSLASVAKAVDGARNRIYHAFDKIDIGIVIYDPDDILVYGNSAVRKLVGDTFDLTIGMSLEEVLTSTWDEERCGMDREDWIAKGLDDLHQYGVAHTVRLGGGRWMRVVNQLLDDGSTLGIRMDVTDLMEREVALEAKETENGLFRAVLDALPMPTFIKDKDFKYVYANPALADVALYKVDEMIGKDDFDLFGKQSFPIRESDTKAMQNGRTDEFEFPMKRPTGDTIHLLSRKTRFDSPDGQNYLLGSTTNITQLKNREAELVSAREAMEASTALLASATSAMAQGLCIIQNKVIQFSNRQLQEQLDVPAELLEPGRDWRDFFDYCFERGDYGWTDRTAVIKDIAHHAANGLNYTVEHEKPDGRWVRVDTHAGAGGMMVMTTSDVTDARKREADLGTLLEKAEDADRAKSEFLANMSHEIRTPMNGVLGMAELLSHTNLDNRQKTFTDIIVKSGTSLLAIINDILDFSKIDAGQMVLASAPFDLRETIEDVASLVSARAVEKDVELIVRIDPSINSRVIGDCGRMRQILTNLVGNAVKFTETGHVLIDLTGKVVDETIRLQVQVEDTGLGIPADKLQAVFDKFSQVDGSSTRRHEGTGLGLAITARLVELMGGKIGVESETGKGSVFTVELELPLDSEKPKPRKAPIDVTGARILVIDDNPVNRQILSEQLSAWSFDGCAAQSGEEGRAVIDAALARGMKIDAIILDYQMPEENGAQVARAIRRDYSEANIPIIMLTSMDVRVAEPDFTDIGVQATLMKPARSSLLFDTILDVLHFGASGGVKQDKPYLENSSAVSPNPANANSGPAKDSDPQETAPSSRPGGWIDDMHKTHNLHVDDEPGKTRENGIDILVAEDNEVNQIVFTQILEQMGVEFMLVGNGRKAVAAWKKYKPALILMDVSMPEMNGYQATGEIREVEAGDTEHPRTPIIGVTAHALTGDRERCLEAGMDDYLSKPISPDKLEAKIRNWIRLEAFGDIGNTA